jgi:hypothetical protein
MTSIIVECREKDAYVNSNNAFGDWTTIIKEPITVQENDQIAVKSTFIDTESIESQKIAIENDLTVSLSMNLYYVRTRVDGQLDIANGDANANLANGGTYIACTQKNAIGEPGFYVCNAIQYVPNNVDNPDWYGDVNLNISFEGLNGPETRSIYLTEANTRVKGQQGGWWSSCGPVIFKPPAGVVPTDRNSDKLGITVTNASQLQAKNIYAGLGQRTWNGTTYPSLNLVYGTQTNSTTWNIVVCPELTTDTYVPIVTTLQFPLAKGNYSPSDLCISINRQIQMNNTKNGTTLQTPFLITNTISANATSAKVQFLGNQITTGDVLFMIKTDATDFFKIKESSGVKYLIGSSQMELGFDDSQQRFQWNYMHCPYFANDVTTPADGKLYSGWLNLAGGFVPINKNGGVVFSDMSAVIQGTTTPYDFWESKLGFLYSNMVGTETTFTKGVGGQLLTVGLRVPKDGINTTTGFTGIEYGVSLNSANWWKIAPSTASLMTSTTDTIQVLGNQNILNIAFTFGYYLVEIQAGFRNNFLTNEEQRQFISQIVSRYYSINSYTSGNDGQIVYTHKGQPMLLTSFKIRILDSNKNVPQDLGNDNTVFIEIIKQTPITKKQIM